MRPTPTTGRLLSVVVVVLALGAGLLVGLGAADTSELLNETVEVDNESDPLTLEVEFVDEFNDTNMTETGVDVTFYNETEFNETGTNATVAHSLTVNGTESDTIVEEVYFEDHAALEYDTEYRLIVEGEDADVERVEVSGGLLGGILGYNADGSPGFGVGVAVVAIAAAGMARARGGS
ncbi:PGF-CTERM sorting domain-containing protein [Natronosalvus rutilus]|uniref:PGF-CTERM sorting domain-containing protein n=1 Tax=Natronosalvus rutilus TaxID=2953753 RepID=A0A9E7N8H6_9EURY|nr:PGF-CTERM sorting domain-containing protein [Natronosalvus rutilus]UTF52816.1 PGF-CTERM sorting domain-containing protein [Natronosalvus rutilus]